MPDRSTNHLQYGRPRPSLSSSRVAEVLVVIGILATVVGILIPAFRQKLELSPGVRSMMNLRQIGLAIETYAAAHSGAYPDQLGSLWRTNPTLPTAVLVCPGSADTPAAGSTPAAVAAAIAAGGHCSYTYAGAGLTTRTAGPATVVAYESTVRFGRGRCNVLYGDGHLASGPLPAVPPRSPAKQ